MENKEQDLERTRDSHLPAANQRDLESPVLERIEQRKQEQEHDDALANEEFQRRLRKARRWIMGFVVVLVINEIIYALTSIHWILLIGRPVAIVGIVVALAVYRRCPRCKAFAVRNEDAYSPRYWFCGRCGLLLDRPGRSDASARKSDGGNGVAERRLHRVRTVSWVGFTNPAPVDTSRRRHRRARS